MVLVEASSDAGDRLARQASHNPKQADELAACWFMPCWVHIIDLSSVGNPIRENCYLPDRDMQSNQPIVSLPKNRSSVSSSKNNYVYEPACIVSIL
jgi:hypothetical protein